MWQDFWCHVLIFSYSRWIVSLWGLGIYPLTRFDANLVDFLGMPQEESQSRMNGSAIRTLLVLVLLTSVQTKHKI